ncbi:MAG: hypothetical protein U0792_22605 [Gemmataceae bacterium]
MCHAFGGLAVEPLLDPADEAAIAVSEVIPRLPDGVGRFAVEWLVTAGIAFFGLNERMIACEPPMLYDSMNCTFRMALA